MMRFILTLTALFLVILTGTSSAQPVVSPAGGSSAQPAVLAASPISAESTTSDSLTIEQSVRLALENHPLIQQAEYGRAATEARIASSRSSYYPDISFAGLYMLLEPVPSLDIPRLGSFQFYPENNYDFHLGLRQTIYDFGKIASSVRLAESARRSAGDYLDLVKSSLAYQTIAAFNAILILHRTIDVLDEQVEALRKHLEISTKKIEAGTATDFDTLTTDVRIAVAQNQRIDASRALETQEIVFRQVTGLPSDRPINLKGNVAAEAVPFNPDSLLAAAEKQRPELVLSRDAESSAAVQAQLVSLGNRPSLALNMTAGFKNGYIPDLDKLEDNLAAGVQLEIPLFNGYRTRYQEREADANLRSAKAHTADVRRQIISEVDQAIAGVKSNREKIKSSEIQVRQAEAALSMARARYEAGVATNLDVLDSQTALSEVKLIRLRAFYDYTVSLNALDKATGKRTW